MNEIAIGIDIGGTNTVLGAVDAHGHILAQTNLSTAAYPSFDAYTDALLDAIRQLAKPYTLRGVGLGAPAGNRFEATIEAPANVPWTGTLPIGRRLEEALLVPAAIDNDANAAALGEMLYGAAQGLRHFVVITLGTGLGSGIVIDGQLLYGAHGFAGELGHISVVPNGRQCACGKHGCLETYVSATGIKRTVFELLAHSTQHSSLRTAKFNTLTAYDIAQAAETNDPIAHEAFRRTGELLGRSLADYAAFSNPEAFILFGGLAKSGKLIMEPAQQAFAANLLFLYQGKTQLRMSTLMDRNSAVLGSAALAWTRIQA